MRNLLSDSARHRWEAIVLVVIALLVGWGGGWFRLTGACTGLTLPPPKLAWQRVAASCVEALPTASQLLGTLGGLAAGGMILYWMDKELRR